MSKVKKRASLTGVRNLAPAAKKVARAAPKRAAPPARGARKVVKKAATASTKKAGKKVAKTAKKSVKKTAPRQAVRGMKKAGKAKGSKLVAKGRRTVIVAVVRGKPTGRPGRLEPIARYAIKPLDPLRKCGPGTSVQYLYRVDESIEGKTTAHLVFFDRHGWYCEHGRTCPAVAPARKYNGHIARVS